LIGFYDGYEMGLENGDILNVKMRKRIDSSVASPYR